MWKRKLPRKLAGMLTAIMVLTSFQIVPVEKVHAETSNLVSISENSASGNNASNIVQRSANTTEQRTVTENILSDYNTSFEAVNDVGNLYWWNDASWGQTNIPRRQYEEAKPAADCGDYYVQVNPANIGDKAQCQIAGEGIAALIKGGKTYEYSYYAKLAEGAIAGVVTLSVIGDWTTSAVVTPDKEVTLNSDEWQKVTGTFTLENDASQVVVRFEGTADVAFCLDELRVAEVPSITITTQPGDAEVDNGENATFTIAASGANLNYQWKINRNDGNGWIEISGASAASYTTSAVDENCDGYQYKCVVSNGDIEVDSNSVTLTIKKYTVSFDTKGSGIIATQRVVKGGKASEPTTPPKTGYIVGGWYSTDNYSTDSKWNFASSTVSANITLYAKWLSTDAGITEISVNGTAGQINGTDITVVLPYGSTISSSLSVAVTQATGATYTQPASVDNGSTWTFTVTAEDGSTTKDYTVNVSVAANPAEGNQTDVDAAKSIIENYNWTVTQETANSIDAIKTWIEQQLAGMNLNDAAYIVSVSDSFTAAIAGTADDKDGTNGSFSFAVSLSKGEDTGNTATSTYASATASVISGTITATAYSNDGGSDNTDGIYQIINGAESSWTAGSSEGLTIRGNGDFDKFTGVKVDGSLLDQSNYTAKEGSTIITLKTSYLNALAAGNHTVEILWTDASASTTFTINANTSDNDDNDQNNDDIDDNNTSSDDKNTSDTDKKDEVPNTGDNTPIVWLFVLVGLSGTGLVLIARKGRKNLKTSR